MNTHTFWTGVIVLTVFFVAIAFVSVIITDKKNQQKEKQRITQELRYALGGGKPSEEMVNIGYKFCPMITGRAGKDLMWPEFETLGGGSREFFDDYLFFGGYRQLSDEKKFEIIAIIGEIKTDKEWYSRPLPERIEILKKLLGDKPPESLS